MTSGCVARVCYFAIFLSVCGHARPFSNCDIQGYGATNVTDVQMMINEALGAMAPANDLNKDGAVNVVDVQIDINAALGLGCVADPGLVSIIPNTGQQGGAPINVTILGRLTNFTSGSVISLGDGITVSNVAAPNATTLTATLTISPTAATTARTLTVDNMALSNAFTVTLPVSISYTYDSQGRLATASYTLASGGVRVVTYSYDAAGNRTAVVAQ